MKYQSIIVSIITVFCFLFGVLNCSGSDSTNGNDVNTCASLCSKVYGGGAKPTTQQAECGGNYWLSKGYDLYNKCPNEPTDPTSCQQCITAIQAKDSECQEIYDSCFK